MGTKSGSGFGETIRAADAWMRRILRLAGGRRSEPASPSTRHAISPTTWEVLVGAYACALEGCIQRGVMGCWPYVFRLDSFDTDADRIRAIRQFSSVWVRNAAGDVARADRIERELAKLSGRSTRFGGFRMGAASSAPKAASLVFSRWHELIRALFVLSFFETSAYGPRNFDAIHRLVGELLTSVKEPYAGATAEERSALIRYAINFDHLAIAADFARQIDGAGSAFAQRLISEFVRCRNLIAERADSIKRSFAHDAISVISTTVWGQEFIDNFISYCLATLLAPGNMPELARQRRLVHSIVTTPDGESRIRSHPLFKALASVARVEFFLFDEELLQDQRASGFEFYRFYGMLDHIHVEFARRLAADLYLLPPDTLYSAGALCAMSRALASEAECVALAYLESEKSALFGALHAARSEDGTLRIDGKTLLTLGAQTITKHFRSLVMSPLTREFCRHPRELFWPMDDGLQMHSVFIHPFGVSGRMFRRTFHPNYENVDYALAPRLLQDEGRVVVLQDAASFAAIHFSPDQREDAYTAGGFSLDAFFAVHLHDYALHRRYFGSGIFLPCGSIGYPRSDAYQEELNAITTVLRRVDFERPPA